MLRHAISSNIPAVASSNSTSLRVEPVSQPRNGVTRTSMSLRMVTNCAGSKAAFSRTIAASSAFSAAGPVARLYASNHAHQSKLAVIAPLRVDRRS